MRRFTVWLTLCIVAMATVALTVESTTAKTKTPASGEYQTSESEKAADEEDSWMLYPGIFLLASFMPLTVLSYRRYRLPKKQKEYQLLMDRLKGQQIEDPGLFSLLENEYSYGDYILPLSFVTVFSVLGFFVLFSHGAKLLLSSLELLQNNGERHFEIGSLIAIGMAFLGTYVWSVQYILRRLVTIDLPPVAYYNIGIRMVFGSFVALVLYQFVNALPTGEFSISTAQIDLIPEKALKDMTPVIAFLTGIVPQRVLRYMIERFSFTASRTGDRAETFPLDMLEGMTPFNKVRLAELGIENVQNMAKASLIELVIKTPYRPSQLVDWIVQGHLCLYFKSKINAMREAGIRTILDFKKMGDQGTLGTLATRSGIDPNSLDMVYNIIKDDESLERLAKAEHCLQAI